MNQPSPWTGAALVALLLLAGGTGAQGCQGSAIPVALPDGFPIPVDIMTSDAAGELSPPADGADSGPPACSCLPSDPCTATDPSCSPATCQDDGDCDDGNPCTEDRCRPSEDLCEHFRLPGCCREAADCDDDIPCTVDSCVDNRCQHRPEPGCCFADEDCDDGMDPTRDLCLAHACYAVFDEPVACERGEDCVLSAADTCYAASCRSGWCTYTAAGGGGCCTRDDQCADADPCTEDHCRRFRCVYVLSDEPQAQLDEDFDDRQVTGLVLTGAIGELGWRFSSDRASSAAYALRYGFATGGYGGSVAFSALAESNLLALPESGPATLRFASWADIEETGDLAVVEAVPLSGVPVVLWTATPGQVWTLEEIDLSPYAGSRLRVRFRFESDGAAPRAREGWYLDDVQAVFRCLPP